MQSSPDNTNLWRVAHDALAAHGRARIAGKPESELRVLWDDYCLALCNATKDNCYEHNTRDNPTG